MLNLRPITPADHSEVLRINAENVEVLAPLDADLLERKRQLAERFDVVERDGVVVGFVVVYAQDAPYWSTNFEWFKANCAEFVYLDRIVLDPHVRRQGLGSEIYRQLETQLAGRSVMALEIVHDNEASLAFHRGRGYLEAGRLQVEDHLNVMMTKELAGQLG